MNTRIYRNYINSFFIAIALIVGGLDAIAQGQETLVPETPNTESMTYQGRLMNGATPANGTYDFQFKITTSDGTVLQTVETLGVPVNNGIFTARFSLNISLFAGANGSTSMNVAVRQLPTDPYTPLAPSQPITGTPIAFKAHYAVQAGIATNATTLNGIASDQFVLTNDSRLSDARNPLPGSGSYIQNNISTQQPASFNITGAGKADVFNAHSYYLLNGSVILSAPGTGNLFAGINAGGANTFGTNNTFVGKSAGVSNALGSFNTFMGSEAGSSNANGDSNTFVGHESGKASTSGYNNVFVGAGSGRSNSAGHDNVLVGIGAGNSNTTGLGNVMIGPNAGYSTTAGNRNVLIGYGVASGDGFGDDNIVIGNQTTIAAGVSNSVAIGTFAHVSLSNRIVLGSNSQNTFVGGSLAVANYPGGGSAPLCVNPSTNIISSCSSSRRFKESIANFNGGLDLIKRLRPVAFTWKDGGVRDVGFVAEEVAEVEPLLATRDTHGEVQGVKYDRISTALVNAVNEQQTQLDRQHGYIKGLQMLTQSQLMEVHRLEDEVAALKALVCEGNASAAVCKEDKK